LLPANIQSFKPCVRAILEPDQGVKCCIFAIVSVQIMVVEIKSR